MECIVKSEVLILLLTFTPLVANNYEGSDLRPITKEGHEPPADGSYCSPAHVGDGTLVAVAPRHLTKVGKKQK